ncbi:methyltransferase family protein [Chelativorans salis]|uniref:Isoprenylcysteine carboxylmethyltransferase family protein n=1 Tax=Chelativorans salis TaxID=2978478 RepID=A0ABT2LN09_9HYPH|nr:isoprenylcysteine carboxylmethyltransferase family protein [Chelativorans sp. EGI FJ00035]MCT7375774.1 isoprenylcysteine carboxylmethyltransferase family protein [Chelativorans sp. EGI FJ00035]
MSDSTEHAPSRIPWPPILYLCAIAASVALAYAVPLPWFGPPLSDLLFAIGWLLLVAGVAMEIFAVRTLRRANTTIMVNRSAEHLVTSGPYAFSRNPIYLGNTAIMFAIGMISGVVWFFIFGIVAAIATQKLAIEPEERHLALRFGKRYRDYQKKARRWF